MTTPRAESRAQSEADRPGPALWRWIGLLAGLGVVSVLHYTTDARHAVAHNIYQRLYYVPIVLGAYWFGVRGGLVTAVAAAAAYFPHIRHTWGHNVPYAASQYIELAIFPCAGLLVGVLADAQRNLTRRHQLAAASLEHANVELRESQEQLRRADRLSALGEIAAGLAHEIRNPLAGIKGALEIVTTRVNAGTPEAEFAGIATTEVQRLDGLVSEFLAYARPREPEFGPGHVKSVVDQVLALLAPEAERAGVALERQDETDVPGVRMDAEQVQQVVFNVVLNAIQASPTGALIDVRVTAEPGWVVLQVDDRGVGIDPAQRERVFEPFVTTKAQGTGLGLAVSQRIIAAHGGRLELRARPGGGTSARVALPQSAGTPAEA